jgi:hypothetical protein
LTFPSALPDDAPATTYLREKGAAAMERGNTEISFTEFRRKVQNSELLAPSVIQLVREIRFSGRVSVVVHNGEILKSGYEEGYFTRKDDRRLV